MGVSKGCVLTDVLSVPCSSGVRSEVGGKQSDDTFDVTSDKWVWWVCANNPIM